MCIFVPLIYHFFCKSSDYTAARTPVAFVTSYCAVGILHAFDSWESQLSRAELQLELFDDACAMATSFLLDEKFKKHQASDLASAIMYWVRCKRGVCPAWRKELTDMTLCNPYTPGAMVAFAHIKELYPTERISLTGLPIAANAHSPISRSTALPKSTTSSSTTTSSSIVSPVRPSAGDLSAPRVEISIKTPTYLRSMSAPSACQMRTPIDQMIGGTSKAMIARGDSSEDELHEPSPVSIAINFDS